MELSHERADGPTNHGIQILKRLEALGSCDWLLWKHQPNGS